MGGGNRFQRAKVLKFLNGREPIERCVACRGTPAESEIVWNYIPIPSFGNPAITRIKVATVGLNPALNEPRLATLADYRKKSREELTDLDVKDCVKRRENYFTDDWHKFFVILDSLLGRVNHLWSYARNVVHIDLVACATRNKFGETPGESREALIENCRPHLLKTLTQLPQDAILLLDGRTVCDRMFRLGQVNFEIGPELILIKPRVEGLRGSITINERQFKFRGWNSPANKLTPLERIDLAIWLRGHCP
jgi:hypothetical protein